MFVLRGEREGKSKLRFTILVITTEMTYMSRGTAPEKKIIAKSYYFGDRRYVDAFAYDRVRNILGILKSIPREPNGESLPLGSKERYELRISGEEPSVHVLSRKDPNPWPTLNIEARDGILFTHDLTSICLLLPRIPQEIKRKQHQ